jgi:hypothetical protein
MTDVVVVIEPGSIGHAIGRRVSAGRQPAGGSEDGC